MPRPKKAAGGAHDPNTPLDLKGAKPQRRLPPQRQHSKNSPARITAARDRARQLSRARQQKLPIKTDVSLDDFEALLDIAESDGISLSEVCRRCLIDGLEAYRVTHDERGAFNERVEQRRHRPFEMRPPSEIEARFSPQEAIMEDPDRPRRRVRRPITAPPPLVEGEDPYSEPVDEAPTEAAV